MGDLRVAVIWGRGWSRVTSQERHPAAEGFLLNWRQIKKEEERDALLRTSNNIYVCTLL